MLFRLCTNFRATLPLRAPGRDRDHLITTAVTTISSNNTSSKESDWMPHWSEGLWEQVIEYPMQIIYGSSMSPWEFHFLGMLDMPTPSRILQKMKFSRRHWRTISGNWKEATQQQIAPILLGFFFIVSILKKNTRWNWLWELFYWLKKGGHVLAFELGTCLSGAPWFDRQASNFGPLPQPVITDYISWHFPSVVKHHTVDRCWCQYVAIVPTGRRVFLAVHIAVY